MKRAEADDPWAAGWEAGYEKALTDIAAESDRITSPRQARFIVGLLRYQLRAETTVVGVAPRPGEDVDTFVDTMVGDPKGWAE